MTSRPTVSIITIFLDAERFITEAIESVLSQTLTDWELLLVDDGSSDGSSALARKYAQQYPGRIHYLEHPGHTNRGMSAARNVGITRAVGRYLAFLDADDVWFSDKLKQQVALLDSHPDVAMVYGASLYWHSWTGSPTDFFNDYVCDTGVAPNTSIEPPLLLRLALRGALTPCPSAILVRRDAVQRSGGFVETFTGLYEDQVFLAKICLAERVLVSSTCWEKYRIHEQSCDSTATRENKHTSGGILFLTWLSEHLANAWPDDTDTRVIVDETLSDLRRHLLAGDALSLAAGDDIRRRQWWLNVNRGSAARLNVLDSAADAVRIEIEEVIGDHAYDVQLNQARMSIAEGVHYILRFRARSDRLRECWVGFAIAYSPWSNLGLFERIDLEQDWILFEQPFIATSTCENARIHFDLGTQPTSVEIAGVQLISTTNGRVIEPDIPVAPRLQK